MYRQCRNHKRITHPLAFQDCIMCSKRVCALCVISNSAFDFKNTWHTLFEENGHEDQSIPPLCSSRVEDSVNNIWRDHINNPGEIYTVAAVPL